MMLSFQLSQTCALKLPLVASRSFTTPFERGDRNRRPVLGHIELDGVTINLVDQWMKATINAVETSA
jgi:hypothetical protein